MYNPLCAREGGAGPQADMGRDDVEWPRVHPEQTRDRKAATWDFPSPRKRLQDERLILALQPHLWSDG